MDKFSFLATILAIYCVTLGTGYVTSDALGRGRFNVTLEELRKQCTNNLGVGSFDLILTNLMQFRNYRVSSLHQFIAATQGSSAQADERTTYVLNQLCGMNQEMILTVNQLINSIQLCINEENRLSQSELQRVLDNALEGVCIQMEFERALFTQPECFREISTSLFSPIDSCSLLYPKHKIVYTLEPIPIVYSNQECSDFIKAADCRFDNSNNCDAIVKTVIKQHFHQAFRLIYCQDQN